MLEVKHNDNLLIKESHQVHTKARKILTCLWVDDVVVDTRLLIPDLNFSRLDNVFVIVEFGGKGGSFLLGR